jgi:hypothetical protein
VKKANLLRIDKESGGGLSGRFDLLVRRQQHKLLSFHNEAIPRQYTEHIRALDDALLFWGNWLANSAYEQFFRADSLARIECRLSFHAPARQEPFGAPADR